MPPEVGWEEIIPWSPRSPFLDKSPNGRQGEWQAPSKLCPSYPSRE